MRGLNGKAVVITGAAGGFGSALARRFGEEGCTVALMDMNGDGVAALTEELSGAGVTAHPYATDITDYEAVVAAVADFHGKTGSVDVLVNNAGFDQFSIFLESEPALWDKIIAINLKGAINLHHACLKIMAEQQSGRVINIASDAGRVGSTGEGVYSACKGGLIAFTKTMAREMARSGVLVNCVAPGPADTALFHNFIGDDEAGQKVRVSLERAIPLRRIAQPEDLPGMVAFLASDDASYITGQVISVSGGLTMAG